MARAKTKQSLPIPFLQDITETFGRVRKDVESTVESVGKKAVGLLPEAGREQVDSVIGRLGDVRGDVNKTVGTLRGEIEKQFKVVRGTIDKRANTLRKEALDRRKAIEKAAQKRATVLLKWLNLPVRNDLDAIKRKLTNLERRIDAIEKGKTAEKGRRAA